MEIEAQVGDKIIFIKKSSDYNVFYNFTEEILQYIDSTNNTIDVMKHLNKHKYKLKKNNMFKTRCFYT